MVLFILLCFFYDHDCTFKWVSMSPICAGSNGCLSRCHCCESDFAEERSGHGCWLWYRHSQVHQYICFLVLTIIVSSLRFLRLLWVSEAVSLVATQVPGCFNIYYDIVSFLVVQLWNS